MKFDYRFLSIIPIFAVPAVLLKSVFITVLLITATIALSYFGSRTHLKKIGLELVTFTTIMIGVMYGLVPGAIIGAVLILIHDFLSGRIAPYLIIVVPCFGMLGALASIFSGADIVMLGVGLTILSHIVFVAWQTFTYRFPVNYLPYFVLNVIMNFFLFSNLAPKIIGLA
jgi:hypothetical protein